MENENIKQKPFSKKKGLKIAGLIFLLIGAVLATWGFISIFGKENIQNFFMVFIGVPLIFLGGISLAYGFMKDDEKQEIKPKKKKPAFDPVTKNSFVASIVKPIEDIKEEPVKKEPVKKEKTIVICPYCGVENVSTASYCKSCGKAIKKKCPSCGAEVSGDANFCESCGAKLQ